MLQSTVSASLTAAAAAAMSPAAAPAKNTPFRSEFDKSAATNSKGTIYFHHTKVAKNGATLRYFSRSIEGSSPIPDNFDVIEVKTGMLLLKKRS